jgi:hypothetical protein
MPAALVARTRGRLGTLALVGTMNGPEHYANAESDLEHAAHASDKGRLDDVAYWLGCAQVHATLALAAAHVSGILMHPEDRAAWDRAIQRPEDDAEVRPCYAHPDDCPNGPESHAYHPPELEGLPCCVQPGEEEPSR